MFICANGLCCLKLLCDIRALIYGKSETYIDSETELFSIRYLKAYELLFNKSTFLTENTQ